MDKEERFYFGQMYHTLMRLLQHPEAVVRDALLEQADRQNLDLSKCLEIYWEHEKVKGDY